MESKEIKPSTDKFARLISVLSLVVAVFAVTLSFWQYLQGQSEKLSIDINPHINRGTIKLTDHDLAHFGKVIQVPWQLIISNTGSRKLSVVKYRLFRVRLTNETSEGELFYTGINGGLFKPNGEQVTFPLILDAGESQLLTAYVGILTDPEAYDILKKNFNDKAFKMLDAVRVLGRAKRDIYGNKAILYEFEGGSFQLNVDPNNQKAPLFMFEISTGRGNQFAAVASDYQ
jgi:hypothetical protein